MTSPAPPQSYVRALKLLLRPLVRGLISQGLTLPHLTPLLKQVYVEAAELFRLSPKRLTDSRVSLLTGVHRKDVKRLRHEDEDQPALSSVAGIGAQVVAQWTGDERYLDAKGRPAPLPRLGAGSFDELVGEVNRDMRPRTLLDEWLRRGLVSLDGEGLVSLNAAAFVPSDDFDDLAFFFGRNLHDHVAVAVHNLEGEERPLLERSTYYDGLTRKSLDELETLAREIGMEALVRLNQEALKRAKADSGQAGADHRFNFGIYFYRDDLALPDIDETAGPVKEADKDDA